MNPLTEAREHVMSILEDAGLPAYAYPPDAPELPAAWLIPSSTWGVPRTLRRSEVAFTVQCAFTTVARNRDALALLEEQAWAVLTALRANGVIVGNVSAPETQTMGALTVTVVEIDTTVLVDD